MNNQAPSVSPQTTAYDKFTSVIKSCETQAHLLTAHRLTLLFKRRFPDEFNLISGLGGALRVKQLEFVSQYKQ